MAYTCPHCHKTVKHLKEHVARMHPEKVEDQAAKPAPAAKEKPGKELKLVVKEKEEPKATETKETTETSESAAYHCVECGTALKFGQNPCPGCLKPLDWNQL